MGSIQFHDKCLVTSFSENPGFQEGDALIVFNQQNITTIVLTFYVTRQVRSARP
jgi:hypothetical protein